MKKSAILLVLMGLSTPLIMCQKGDESFNVNDRNGLPLLFNFHRLKEYKGNSALDRATLKMALAPTLLGSCCFNAIREIAKGSTIENKARNGLAWTAAGILLPFLCLFDTALELAVGNHVSIAHQMAQSSMPETSLMNALDLW